LFKISNLEKGQRETCTVNKTVYQNGKKIDSSIFQKIVYEDGKPLLEIVYLKSNFIDFKKVYSYEKGRLVTEETIPSSTEKKSKIKYEYNADGQLKKETYSFNNKAVTIKEYKYSGNMLLSTEEYEKGKNALRLISRDINIYDSAGQLSKEFVIGSNSDTNYYAFIEFDKSTREKKVCSYDKNHKLIHCLEEYFDSSGRIKEEIVSAENEIKTHTYYQYNENGSVSELKRYDNKTNLIYEEYYEQEVDGRQKKVIKDFNTNIVTEFVFDGKKRIIKEVTKNDSDIVILNYSYSQLK